MKKIAAKEAVAALKKASKDLLYPSESDEPFTVETWEKMPVAEVSLATFFGELAKGDERFRALLQTIKDNLRNVKVFRVGAVQLDLYIVGTTGDGSIVVLQTAAVET